MKAWARRTTITLLATLSLTAGFASASGAAEVTTVETHSITQQATLPSTGTIMAADDKCPGGGASCLPLNRWGGATSTFHARLGSKPWEDVMERFQRQTMSGLTSVGTMEWQLASDFTESAVNFNVLNYAGAQIDHAFGNVVNSMLGNAKANNGGGTSIVGIIVVISVAATFFRAATRRDISVANKLFKMAATLAVMVVMANGALHSTGTTAAEIRSGSAASFSPGKFSPGWFLKNINSSMSSLASGPTKQISGAKYVAGSKAKDGHAIVDKKSVTFDKVTCDDYVRALNDRAMKSSNGKVGASAVSLVISQMWVNSGLQAWASSQYGVNNNYGEAAYCHQLEWQSGVSRGRHRAIMLEAAPNSNIPDPANGLTSLDPRDKVETDNSLVAWGACQLKAGADGRKADSWIVDDNWRNTQWLGKDDSGKKGHGVTRQACADWWSDTGFKSNGSAFEFVNGGDIEKATAGLSEYDVRDYLNTLQGHSVGSGMVGTLAYVVSGLCILLAFGVISLAIIFGKLSQVVMLFGLAFVMIMSLWVGKADDAKVAKYVKSLLGTTIFVALASLIMAFLSMMTDIVASVGVGTFGGASLLGILWTGASPLIAMSVIGMVVKSAGAPNPFKLGSALAFGAAAGGVGGVVASKLSGAGEAAKRRASSMGKRATGLTGGGGGRGAGGAAANAGPGDGSGKRGVREALRNSGSTKDDAGMTRDIKSGGRRGAIGAVLGAAGALSMKPKAIAERDDFEKSMTADERQDLAEKQRMLPKRIQNEARDVRKKQRAERREERRAHNDALAKSRGWGRTNGEGRLVAPNWNSRQMALARGKALEKVQGMYRGVRQNPGRVAKLGLAGAAIAATGGIAAAPIAARAAIKGWSDGRVQAGARSARDKVLHGRTAKQKESYEQAVRNLHKRDSEEAAESAEKKIEQLSEKRESERNQRVNTARESAREALQEQIGVGPMTKQQAEHVEQVVAEKGEKAAAGWDEEHGSRHQEEYKNIRARARASVDTAFDRRGNPRTKR